MDPTSICGARSVRFRVMRIMRTIGASRDEEDSIYSLLRDVLSLIPGVLCVAGGLQCSYELKE